MNKELIELITDTVSKRAEVETATIYNACEARGFVRGTYTSYISMMKKAGYLRRVKPQVYAIGRPASAQTIALNLQRLQLHKKGVRPQNAPVENEQVERKKPSESLLKKPYVPFKNLDNSTEIQKVIDNNENSVKSELAKFNRNQAIMDAVGVLKSYGLKITIEF
jgi:hypothetical protein